MSRWWGKLITPVIVLLIVAFLVGVMRWTAPERGRLSFVESILRDLLSPVTGGITLVVNQTGELISVIKDYGRYQAENRMLRQQVAELIAANVLMEEYKQENERLRQLLEYKENNQHLFDFAIAPVIGRNPSNWYHTLTIGLGENAGMKQNQVVVTSQGVVGRIIATTPRTSEVLLILDRDGALGGMVQSNRTPGIVEGSSDYRGYLQMIRISRDAPVEVNQVIVTSGLGGIFPKGLLLGTVVKVIPESDGLMNRAIIAPSVDFDHLEEVLVITGDKGGSLDAVAGDDNPGPGESGPASNPVAGL